MQAILLGLGAVFAYGIMVGVQSLIGMFRYDKSCWPLAFGYIAYLVFVPLTMFIPGLYPQANGDDFSSHSLWKICLLLLLVGMWLILGFFIKASYLRITTGETYWKPRAQAKKRIMVGIAAGTVGAVVWFAGLTGNLAFLTGWWEKSVIILSLYLVVQGLTLIIRNMKYLREQPKETIKTAASVKKQGGSSKKKSNKPVQQHISYKGKKKAKAQNGEKPQA